MTDERDVRNWLATAEAPELRLDLRQTVETGREKAHRRQVRRIAGTAALGLAALVAIPGAIAIASRDRTDSLPDEPAASASASASATAVPTSIPNADPNACGYHVLPLPDDPAVKAMKRPRVVVSDVDPTGRYAVGWVKAWERPDGPTLMILWENGKARLMPPETTNGIPMSVNEQGHVLGKSGNNPYGAVGSWVYRNGSMDRLGIPADAAGHDVVDINAAGDVLGSLVYHPSGATELQGRVAIWKTGNLAVPEVLPNPPNALWSASRFSADGKILGHLVPGLRPYVWSGPGRGKELTQAIGTNLETANGDWVVALAERGEHVYRWRLSTGKVTEVTVSDRPGFRTEVVSVLPDGTVTAVGRQETGVPNAYPPLYVVRGGQHKELPAPDGFFVLSSYLSLDGTVVYGEVSVKLYESDAQGEGLRAPAYWTC